MSVEFRQVCCGLVFVIVLVKFIQFSTTFSGHEVPKINNVRGKF